MNRSLTALVVALVCAAPALVVSASAQNLSNDQETRILKVAEQRVVEVLRDRPELLGQLPRVSGSALIDGDHAQVDAFYVKNDQVVPHSAERFVFTVSSDSVVSVGAPNGEVAALPHRSPVERAQTDALSRFAKVHPAIDAADGTKPTIKTTRTAANGQLVVEVESFGGIAGMWMGDSISFSYTSDGIFVSQLH